MARVRSTADGHPAVIPRLPVWLRIATAAGGVALLVLGAGAVFVTENGSGSAALVAAGTVLVIVAALAERIESIEGGGVKVQLSAVATARQAAARSMETEAARLAGAGHEEDANRLLDEAEALRRQAQAAAETYNLLRANMPSSWERTATIENLLERTIENVPIVEPSTVRDLFTSGDPGSRAVALRLMQAQPETTDVFSVMSAIREPTSPMEQWRALAAADSFVTSRRGTREAVTLQAGVRAAMDDGLIDPDSADRFALAQRIVGN